MDQIQNRLQELPQKVDLNADFNPVEQLLTTISPRKTPDGISNREALIKSSHQYYLDDSGDPKSAFPKAAATFSGSQIRPASTPKKIMLLFSRSLHNTLKDKQLFVLYIMQQLLSMIFVSIIYKNMNRNYDSTSADGRANVKNRIGSFFSIVMNTYISALINTSMKMGQESSIIYKEIKGGLYHPWIYYSTKSVIDLLILIPLIALTLTGVTRVLLVLLLVSYAARAGHVPETP